MAQKAEELLSVLAPYLLSTLTVTVNVNYKEINCVYFSVLQNTEHFQLNNVCVYL